MIPLGLTFKNLRVNQYTGRTSGELMIVHRCVNCGHVSCNRIAGDDNNYSLYCLLNNSESLNPNILNVVKRLGITLLNQDDTEEVLISLYGYNYQKYIN